MLGYVIRRLLQTIPVLLIVAVTVFGVIRLAPGDPAAVLLGADATEEQVAALRASMGLDLPPVQQFANWIGGILVGDLGDSVFLEESVSEAILSHAEPTVMLALAAGILAVLIAIPAGVIAASRRGTAIDSLFMGGTLLGISTPTFLMALFLVLIFGVLLRILPVAGYTSPFQDFGDFLLRIAMPAVALGLAQAAFIARMTRSSMLDVLSQNYIETARSKGVANVAVLIVHALRNASIPIITVVGQSFGALLTGAIVVETVFGIPGIGQLIANSINRRDYNVIQAVVLVCAVLYVALNLVIDLLYGLLDPRMRKAR